MLVMMENFLPEARKALEVALVLWARVSAEAEQEQEQEQEQEPTAPVRVPAPGPGLRALLRASEGLTTMHALARG